MPSRDPEKRKEYQRTYYLANRQKALDHATQWRKDNSERHAEVKRRYNLRIQYGLTVEQYDAMLETQGGVCAICGDLPSGKALHVDHNHKDGAIRGLLCNRCNRCLGLFKDDPAVIKAALDYLEETRGTTR